MKKKMSFIAILLVLISVFTLTGCGGGEEDDGVDPVVGKYSIAQAEYDGRTMSAKDLGMEFIFDIREDGGTATVDGEKEDFTWTARDYNITIKASDGTKYKGIFNDDFTVLTFEDFVDTGVTVDFVIEGHELQ